MRWILGVDALGRAGGAVAFGDWVAHRTKQEIMPIHVLEVFDELLPGADSRAFREWSQKAAAALLGDRDWGALSTIEAMPAEEGLKQALRDVHADALILGRRADTDSKRLVRLGRVARRLARELPTPVVVVPRDYEPDMKSYDPILLATDLTDASSEAARFAMRLAVEVDRPLVAVHTIEGPAAMAAYLPEDIWTGTQQKLHETSKADLDRWCDEHDLGDAARRVISGPPAAGVLAAAEEVHAAIIVTGSRRLGAVDRLFLFSTASELAASSRVPLAIVPPPGKAPATEPVPVTA